MLARRAAGGPLNADETCGGQVAVTHHSAEWFNNSGLQGDCNPASAPWATVPMTKCRAAGDKTWRAHTVEDIIGYS
jgi:hypothetical protein